jgi:hypothetical protein
VFGVSVVVSYEKAQLWPTLQHAWLRLGFNRLRMWQPRRWATALVLGAVFVPIAISSLAWFLNVNERRSRQTQIAENIETVTVASPFPSNTSTVASPSTTVSANLQNSQIASPTAAPSEPAPTATPEVLRSNEAHTFSSLLKVKKICVEAIGDIRIDPEIIEHLSSSLQASQRWITVTCDEADALLSVEGGSDEREIFVRLINEEGKTIWPRTGSDSTRRYEARAEEAAKVIADLLADIRQLDHRRLGR